jgi:chromate transporter
VVTWFTFLPSFLFILAGGPLVEATHGRLGFTAPLLAITAAVVGVIASLAAVLHRARGARRGGPQHLAGWASGGARAGGAGGRGR